MFLTALVSLNEGEIKMCVLAFFMAFKVMFVEVLFLSVDNKVPK